MSLKTKKENTNQIKYLAEHSHIKKERLIRANKQHEKINNQSKQHIPANREIIER